MTKLRPTFIVTGEDGREFAIFHPESPSIIDAAMTAAEHWGDADLKGVYTVRKEGDDRVHSVDLADVTGVDDEDEEMVCSVRGEVVNVQITNTYSDGHESSETVTVPAPMGSPTDAWWQDVVFPETGDGHGVDRPDLTSLHVATIVEASDPRLIDATNIWEG